MITLLMLFLASLLFGGYENNDNKKLKYKPQHLYKDKVDHHKNNEKDAYPNIQIINIHYKHTNKDVEGSKEIILQDRDGNLRCSCNFKNLRCRCATAGDRSEEIDDVEFVVDKNNKESNKKKSNNKERSNMEKSNNHNRNIEEMLEHLENYILRPKKPSTPGFFWRCHDGRCKLIHFENEPDAKLKLLRCADRKCFGILDEKEVSVRDEGESDYSYSDYNITTTNSNEFYYTKSNNTGNNTGDNDNKCNNAGR